MDFQKIETAITERMREQNLHPEIISEFLRRVRLVQQGYSGKIPWNEIGDLSPSDSVRLEDLPAHSGSSLSDLVVIKLNGGLGTSMGLSRAKSLMTVKNEKSFLAIMMDQLKHARGRYGKIPLILMNSFNTREDTLSVPGIQQINQGCPGDIPVDFLQNMVPRIRSSDFLPIGDGKSNAHWCPPGHGDIYLSLRITGILDRMLDAGYRMAFLSNGDNLGAVIDERIYSFLKNEKLEYTMEVTPKSLADLKGGVLYRRMENGRAGHIELLETAQVEDAHLGDFQDVKRFAYFSINNLWVNLESLRDRLKKGGFNLSLIVNPKETDGEKVLQLETAMGSAVGQFEKTKVVIVPRRRFSPVKTCADLLARRSDAAVLDPSDLALVLHPDRRDEPIIVLDSNYKNIGDFDRLVKTPPSLLHAEKLEVEGPVLFDRQVEIRGNVKFVNRKKEVSAVSTLGKSVFENETAEL